MTIEDAAYRDGQQQAWIDKYLQRPRQPSLWGWDCDPGLSPEVKQAYERGYNEVRPTEEAA